MQKTKQAIAKVMGIPNSLKLAFFAAASRDNLSPAGWIAAGLDKFLISYVKNCIFVIELLKVGLRKI